jgi:uncharacterized protein (DUF1501 family)
MEIEAQDWFACDGLGHGETPAPSVCARVSRRGLLAGISAAALGWAASPAVAQLSIGNGSETDHVLVTIFLRGGADCLNMVVPNGEAAYHRNRPVLAVKDSLPLDNFFGLNRAMGAILPLFREGDLAIVQAVGSGDQTRSHFEAMNTMERGLAGGTEGDSSGWLARHLLATPRSRATPLRAVAISRTMPDALKGATNTIALEELANYRLDVGQGDGESVRRKLADLYSDGKDPLTSAGRETLEVLGTLNRLDPRSYKPSAGAIYPKSDLGSALTQVAFLIKANVGLEVVCLDKGGWDTHYGQNLGGQMTGLLDDLGKCLAAFHQDLGGEMKRVTVTVQTEFGRRVRENQSLGTDHGRASAMFVLGKGIKGGKVLGKWPGMEDSQLDEVGDLRVTTDYRSVLAEVLDNRLGTADISKVFGSAPQPVGMS